jgi:hypothetical protein
MKPICQLLALVLEQMTGYKHKTDPHYFKRLEQTLLNKKKDHKKVQDKIIDLRMQEVEEIIFKPILLDLHRKRQKGSCMGDYFQRTYLTIDPTCMGEDV